MPIDFDNADNAALRRDTLAHALPEFDGERAREYAAELMELADALHSLQEKYCSDPNWSPADARAEESKMDRVRDILDAAGRPTPFLNGDPRGYAVKFQPDETPEDWPFVDFGGFGYIPDGDR
ncbi:hypothetical protein [Salinibacter phage M8CRM-1]|uniref:Uncharacterized protein n=3 Tax=Kryptosalinivirus TaxID=2560163 RepID=A0A2I6UG83_9CAUD|nr:hypothetical protein FGG63_gp71 [Salinibacter phage M8CC-19]YP_009639536.1 hypothetical protein FGG67_gp70 [Salinibacter phage M8CRM-1]AUO78994.1 hypothetical protein [Salinibacter phage M8CC-19]AUO79155.1 hypothetical protein [Salinibacter phage M8CRM-1]AUO79229.1 hypothetical protein [Salinibacter phage M31CC-1]